VTIQLYLAFVAAAALLIVIPGPNVALVVATSVAHGPRQGLATVAGTSAAIAIQLALVSLGLAQILGGLGALFDWLRWAGAGYLLWLGVRAWRAPPEDLSIIRPQTGSLGRRFARGLLVSLTNPKTLFFFGAFFPQFLDARAPLGPQLALLSATFLAMAVLTDSLWALFAGRMRSFLRHHGNLRNRITGGVYIVAGLGLAAARRAS